MPDDISAFNIKAATYHNYTYDGTAKNPGVWISPENGINFCLDEGVDYTLTYLDNPITAGSKRVLVEGIGWFTGAKQIEYVIEPTEICYIEMNTTEFIYDGMAKRPILTVEGPDKVLVEGVDYLVSWPSDVTNVGKKGIVVTGIGNYMGTYDTTYEIFAAPDELPDSNTPDAPDESSTPNDPGTTDPTPDYPGATDPEPVATEAMFRLYNPNSGEHFYSSSTVERDHLISLGWQDEGTGWIAPASGDAVYRLYNPYAGEHHYTLSAAERDMLVSVGWNDEGIGWYSDPNESVPLYRVYNPNEYANNHHYTTSAAERDMLLSIGWQDEGVSWHGVG